MRKLILLSAKSLGLNLFKGSVSQSPKFRVTEIMLMGKVDSNNQNQLKFIQIIKLNQTVLQKINGGN